MKNDKLRVLLILASAVPAMGGTISTFTGNVDNLTGTNENYSTNSAPINTSSAGSYKDLLLTGNQTNLLQTNTNFHLESLSVTNGSSYTISGFSASAPSIRVGSSGYTTSEQNAAFTNVNSGGSQDLIYLSGNSSLRINQANSSTGGNLTLSIRQSGNFNVTTGSTLTIDAAVAQKGSGLNLTMTGGGTTKFGGTNTFTGNMSVSNGIVEVATSGTLLSNMTVAAGSKFIHNGSAAYAKTLTLNGNGTSSRATLSGNATVGTSVVLDNVGDTLAPGNSPGTMSFTTAQTWNSFSYNWELNNFTGTNAGTDFDKIAITGGLTLNASSGNYILNILSLTDGNVSGAVSNFSESNQSWTILSTTAGITNFNATKWTLNKDGFSASATPTGSFALNMVGTDLVLAYTAVPETSALAITLSAAAMLVSRRRRMAH